MCIFIIGRYWPMAAGILRDWWMLHVWYSSVPTDWFS